MSTGYTLIKISAQPYHNTLNIIVCPRAKGQKYFNTKYKTAIENLEYYDGIYIKVKDAEGYFQYYIWLEKWENKAKDYSVFSHELLHYVIDSLYGAGIKLCEESEEAFTYYYGHLMGLFIQQIVKLNKS